MADEKLSWKILGLLAVFLSVLPAAYISYDVWARGTSPEKRLDLKQYPPNDPMSALKSLGNRGSLSFRIDDRTIDNVLIGTAFLTNVGKAPILPEDFKEPLTISVQKPFEIVAVESGGGMLGTGVSMQWKRSEDGSFVAAPVLLNPQDRVFTTVYLANTNAAEKAKPVIKWHTRIVNLKGFTEPKSDIEEASKGQWGIAVELGGWGVPFTLAVALVFQALYLRLGDTGRLLSNWRTIAFVLISTLFSVSAAESLSTYLFPTLLTALTGVDPWVNLPPILLNALALGALYWTRRRDSRTRDLAVVRQPDENPRYVDRSEG